MVFGSGFECNRVRNSIPHEEGFWFLKLIQNFPKAKNKQLTHVLGSLAYLDLHYSVKRSSVGRASDSGSRSAGIETRAGRLVMESDST